MLLFVLCVSVNAWGNGVDGSLGYDYTPDADNYERATAAARHELERIQLQWYYQQQNHQHEEDPLWCYTLNPQPYPDKVYEIIATVLCHTTRGCVFKNNQAKVNAKYAEYEKHRQECLAARNTPVIGCEFDGYNTGMPRYTPKVSNQFCLFKRKEGL